MKLLTKNRKLTLPYGNFSSLGLQLSPAKTSGQNVCPNSTAECRKHCIAFTGFGRYTNVKNARIARTLLFFYQREEFLKQLHHELRAFVRNCNKQNLRPCVRLNVFSDLRWEKIAPDIFREFNEVLFYDYTKIFSRIMRSLNNSAGSLWPSNYQLTFSHSGNNLDKCREVLKAGGNVATVFESLPSFWEGYPVVNGDSHDYRLRETDGKNVVVGLKPKGSLKRATSNFKVSLL